MSEIPQDPYAAGGGTGQYQAGPYPGGPYPGGPTGPYPGGAQPGPYGYGYPMPTGTNTLAILALVFAFICSPAAIVMGVLARKQIRRTGEQGMGLATAGMVVGIVFTVLSAIWIIAMIVFFASAVHQIHDQSGVSATLAAAHAATRAYFGL